MPYLNRWTCYATFAHFILSLFYHDLLSVNDVTSKQAGCYVTLSHITIAYAVSPYGYHSIDVLNLIKLKLLSKVTLWNEDYACMLNVYAFSPVNYVTLSSYIMFLITYILQHIIILN